MPPATPETAAFLRQQIKDLFEMALYFAVCHQVDKTGSRIQRLVAHRASSIRLYDPNEPPIPPLDEGRVRISSSELEPDLRERMRRSFECLDSLVEARENRDSLSGWRARSALGGLRKELKLDILRDELPSSVPLLLDVAEKLAVAPRKTSWKTVMEKHCETIKDDPRPPGRGA